MCIRDSHWAHTKSLKELGVPQICLHCAKILPNRQALAIHSFKTHGIKAIHRQYLNTTHCTVCLTEFWSRERAVCHLQKSGVCMANLQMRHFNSPPFSIEQSSYLDAIELKRNRLLHAKGMRRHFVQNRCIQLNGPLWPIIYASEDDAISAHPLGPGHFRRA